MNKRGFTLVEVVAVLAILSLILVISVTAVTQLLQKSKESIYDNQIKQIESAARIWGADHMLILPNDAENAVVCNYSDINNCPENYKKLVITLKDLQNGGYINKEIINPKTNREIANATIEIEKKGKKLTYKVTIEEDNTYAEIILNGADPVLQDDMIPVTIDNDGTVKKADTTKEWYSYGDKKWANAVVLVDNSTYEVGATIPENKIKAYYVWIPRYKYQLFESTSPTEIQITFESNYATKSKTTSTGNYLTHPAFTYGTEELKGFWVGKFETTPSATAPTIKPNTSSLRSQQVSKQYATSLLVSDSSRMMKNDEWGAVAYLSHSAYGTNKQIRINNNSSYKTGCGASEEDKASSSSCEIQYGNATSYPQSTTGNITGIFDMSGGAWEYMMSVRSDSEGNPLSGRNATYNSGFNGNFGSPGEGEATSLTTGVDFPTERKNYIVYDNPANRNSITGDNGCNGSKCYGHALTETKNWYGDYYYFPSLTGPWVLRGGRYSNGANAGVFSADSDGGHAYGYGSFRVVVPAS